MKINELKDKKILILGFGEEGMDTYKFLRKLFPNKILGIADKFKIQDLKSKAKDLIKKDKNLEFYFGENYLKAIKKYDTVIKSPGIFIHLPEVEKAFNEGKITSQTEIFFENIQSKIIGITGTKGKGTTASLIYQIFKKAGIKVYLIGNIGKPVLSFLFRKRQKNEVFIYELSSHQLMTLKTGPHVAIFVNIFPDHLDYYKNFKEYFFAKANICKYQKKDGCFIYNADYLIIEKIAKKIQAKKIPFSLDFKKINQFKKFIFEKKVNIGSTIPAVIAAKLFKISDEKIIAGIKNFKNQKHRLEFIGKFKGIDFYDDSAATIPEATILAIRVLKDKLETLILGGSEKNLDFSNLAQEILKTKIKTIILFPSTGQKIYEEIKKIKNKNIQKINFLNVNNMKDAVVLAYKFTSLNKICLLSPASASFGIFKDYKDRGCLFKKFVAQG
ncbi:MAG: UDP-N-acetylmuramoyl-L-alanine--D-glutamate ligase [Patescibacteria group bacterium]